MKKIVTELENLEGKRVLVRVDFNVPIKNGEIVSDVRIVEALPTIDYLAGQKAKVILCSHLGRPDGKKDMNYSLKIVQEYLQKLLPKLNVKFCNDCVGEEAEKCVKELQDGEVLVLENVRFYAEEEENDEEFSKKLARLADIYVFDAFGTAHRKHCSTYGVSKLLPNAVGFLVSKELSCFHEALNEPKKPVVAILGGAKISDKISVVENLLSTANYILIGGGMCFTFLKAINAKVGNSLVDNEQVDFCLKIIKLAIDRKVAIILPVDFVCAKSMEDRTDVKICKLNKFPDGYMGLDIGPKTVKKFAKIIKKARTIIWNGPLGAYEYPEFKNGTRLIAEFINKNKKCFSIAGGGDVVASIEEFGLQDGFSHISTGGGASLKLIEGKNLDCISVISESEEIKGE